MACNTPIHGWLSTSGGFTMSGANAYLDYRMSVPCGQCMGCRLAKTAEWATRITHEASLYTISCFITLTYSDDNLTWVNESYEIQYYQRKYTESLKPVQKRRIIPAYGATLVKHDLQRFFKRLRKYLEPSKIRYFASGEYGDQGERPHYHAIIFNYWPEDTQEINQKNQTEYKLFTSPKLARLWKNGNITIGECNYETAAYTASYVTKKINGTNKRFHYRGRDAEFANMSRRPGLGLEWYNTYKDQTWQHNSVISREREVAPPRYYKNKLKDEDEAKHFEVKLKTIRKREEERRLFTTERFMREKQKFFSKDNIN